MALGSNVDVAMSRTLESNTDGLRIVTYNCRSVKSSIGSVQQLCSNSDIVMLQEHWLLPDDVGFLSSIDADFVAFGSSAVDTQSNLLTGRPYGGTAILCRRTLAASAKLMTNTGSRITAVEMKVSDSKVESSILLISVYMPTDSGSEADEDFEFVCGTIDALLTDSSVTGYVIAGDFNFRPTSVRHNFICNCLTSHSPTIVDLNLLDDNSFTYVSDCHSSTSWIDHVIVNDGLASVISHMSVLYDVIGSDHSPISFNLNVDVPTSNFTVISNQDTWIMKSDWEACTEIDICRYSHFLDQLLQSVPMPSLCCMQNCAESSHIIDITEYHKIICTCIKEAEYKFIPTKSIKSSEYTVAGWNDLVNDKHEAAREAFLQWVAMGKPKTGYVCEMMKRTRAQFKLALRYCKNQEETLRCNAMARKVLSSNTQFWKDVKNASRCKATNNTDTVNGISGDTQIAEMWKDTFQKLYSMHNNENLSNNFEGYTTDTNYVITIENMYSAINQLKSRKSTGPDGIPTEAIKHASRLLAVHLNLLFNMCLCHSYIPTNLTQTTLVPLLKNKSGDVTDINNYRAIALSSCLSKLFESLILTCCKSHDMCCDDDVYQFGYKKDHSTSLGCATLKHVVDYYRSNGSYVFACFLDLSKAFDSVDHTCLFRQLVKLKLPENVVKLLIHWYTNQLMNVRWKHIQSGSFYMKNGTRQGSVLSPYLFTVYMRCVTTDVIQTGLGCHIGSKPVCILLYADDIVILAPSWYAQQCLLNVCAESITRLGMSLNVSKSVTMIYKPYKTARYVPYSFPNFMLNGAVLNTVDSCKYLGHILSSTDDDNPDIIRQMGMLYARTNMLIRKFSKCDVNVKLCLFRAYCTQFYGCSTWKRFKITVMRRFEAAYVKCIKSFFGFERRYSVTKMFCDLGLPTFNTVIHNAQVRLYDRVDIHNNELVMHVFHIW